MTNYLITSKNTPEHYFYKPYEGICCRHSSPGGTWQEHTNVIENGKDGFSVFADKSGNVHLICTDNENNLIYAVRKSGIWKRYALSSLSEDIFVSQMQLYSVGDRLNLLYSALYNGENLLVHCVLGNHAKPSTVASMENPHFFVDSDRVYYTNAHGQLGYSQLADEKPAQFVKCYEDGHYCTISRYGGNEFMLFLRDSKLFLNGSELLYDSRIELPLFVCGADRLYIMWKSGSFIRYITSFNGGAAWSEPMRFMNTAMPFSLYTAPKDGGICLYYGYHSNKELTLLGKPDIFRSAVSCSLPSQSELELLKNALSSAQQELADTKKEVSRLSGLLENAGLK